jgi:hypothetical protein
MTAIITTITAADANAAPGFSGSPSQGVTRVQLGTGTEGPAALPGRGSTATDYTTTTRVSSADIGAGSGDVQAVSPTGRPLAPSEIKADSIVRVGGLEMKASIAERMGLLVRDSGGYRSAAPSVPSSSQQGTQEARNDEGAASDTPLLSDDVQATLRGYNEAAGGDTTKAALELLDAGEITTGTLAKIASARGVEPAQVLADAEQIEAGFRAQAQAVIGDETGETLATAAHLFPAEYDRAVRAQALQGDTSGFVALAQRVTDHAIRNAQSLEAADGLTVRKVGAEYVVAGLDGVPGEIPVRQAVRLGFVSVTVAR